MRLYKFAFCHNYEEKIKSLAQMSPEKWSFGDSDDLVILRNYIEYTFLKLFDEGKVLETEAYALFHTGLYTQHLEEIYAYFEPNRAEDRQKWFLVGFQTGYQLKHSAITEFPKRANYFSNPAELVFDTNCDILLQYQHIINEPQNFLRIPEQIRSNPSGMLRTLFDGAIKNAKIMIDSNYKNAVPQYYKGQIQLLVPMCLQDSNQPDLALVVSKHDTNSIYLGHTCLTLDMAYNNARLIAKPDSMWLKP